MLWMALLLIVIIVIALAFIKPTKSHKAALPYRVAEALFTPAERSLLGVLNQAVGPDYRVFGKVRLADIAIPVKGLTSSNWQRAFNRISAKHIDFVVCRANDLSLVCAVELNDKSHQRQARKQRDQFVSDVCQSIGLPLLVIEAKRSYSVAAIQQQFIAATSTATPK